MSEATRTRRCKLVKAILTNRKHVSFKNMDKLLRAFGYEPKNREEVATMFTEKKE